MYRTLLATTAIVALATPLAAETVVSTKKTEPLKTSTIKAGAADSIKIDAQGSVVIAAGTGVTMDSNHAVTNGGAITISNANDASVIDASAATAGDSSNTGTITFDESYTPTDIDNDGDLDGPFAVGSGRAGIRTLGAHSGKIVNSGTIAIEGNNSAGIVLGGQQTGAFTNDGKVTVVGDNAVGVSAQGITGNVRLAGTVTATGVNAVGARFAGNIDGAMTVQGAIGATGYRAITSPTDPSKLDADDLLQGGSALMVEGNVTGGIVLAVAPKDTNTADPDEDKDGLDDAKEGNAAVVSYSAAPAMVIGATDHAVAIGAVANSGTNFGLIVDGSIAGNGVYSGVSATGLAIGGRGGAVSIANGMSVAGAISATSAGADATALKIGAQATVPEVRVSGTVSATGSNSGTTRATAILIDQGASVATIRNSGTIKSSATGVDGVATAILDRSGGVSLVENSGAISASGAAATSFRNVAIDLSANTLGTTVRQIAVASGKTAPSITGDVRFGSGNDLFDIADGSMKGNVTFGAGSNRLQLSGDGAQNGNVSFGNGADTMTLADSSVFEGTADFGGGADVLTLAGTSRFSGSLANAGNLAVTVSGGTLDLAKPASIGSLSVASGGILNVTLSKAAGQGTLIDVAGTATIASGAKLRLVLTDVASAEGHYVVLKAGNLQAASGIAADSTLLPFLYKGTVDTGTANQLAVDIARKNATELGLNRSESAAYNAIYAALAKDDKVAGVFLGINEGDKFRSTFAQMLPDHAGGTFETISLGARTMTRRLADPRGPLSPNSKFGLIFDAGSWDSDKDRGATAGYDLFGVGFTAGGEIRTGVGDFGATATYLISRQTSALDTSVTSDAFELGGQWVGHWGGLGAFARASIGKVTFDGERHFDGTFGTTNVSRTIAGKWDGTLNTLMGGVSFEGGGQYLFFRPSLIVDYVRLKENAHSETGGGAALDLTIDERTSDSLAVNGGVAFGVDLHGMRKRDTSWFRIEGEGGWREIVGGTIGRTTAHFAGGTPFTIEADPEANGWYARLRAIGGSEGLTMTGEVGAEQRHDTVGVTLRGTIKMGL
jgi:hypothetical protein